MRKLWPRGPKHDLAEFKANYVTEGHLPVSVKLRAIAHEPGRCTTCGLCDIACVQVLSPMRLLLQQPREVPESCLSCKACEEACPEDIPILEYVTLASKTFHSGPTWNN
ncbi:MAG: 4Fe-4S dicluster domain-containing protein [Deltaproteobacteria bacterium]|nr:4Fe-4S dicluster domain-containing protein [Deltaproteobacteria bacterium]